MADKNEESAVEKMREAGERMTAIGCLMFMVFTFPLLMAIAFGKWGFWAGVVVGLVILITAVRQFNG